MTTLLILYNYPSDSDDFDDHFQATHLPLLQKLPGVRSITINSSPIVPTGEEARYYASVALEFDSLTTAQSIQSTPEGQAVVNDIATSFPAGAEGLIYDTQTV